MRLSPLRIAASLLAACVLCGCAAGSAASGAPVSSSVAPGTPLLRDAAGAETSLADRVSRARFSVFVFFSADCPVQKAHDARLRELADAYVPRGVAFAIVASDAGADLAEEREAAVHRGLAMPLLEDKGAAFADALGVEYSTHAVLMDRDRRVLYSGALDSDRTHLTSGATPWLKEAIEAALAGKPVTKAKTEPLGCPLRKH